MLSDDIKIYNAAKHSTTPRMPLREELNIFAIECIYEPKATKTRLKRFARKPRKMKRNKGNKKSDKKKRWPFHSRKDNRNVASDEGSYFDSTTSSLTMPSVLDAESNYIDIEDNSFNKLEEAEIPSLMFTDDELDSEDEMDDMTLSTFALVGSDNVKPDVIFTQADETDSLKWWYENEKINNLDNFSDILRNKKKKADYDSLLNSNNYSYKNCLEGTFINIDNDQLICCSAMQKYNLIENHDLELEVGYDDNAPFSQKLSFSDVSQKDLVYEKKSNIDSILFLNEEEDIRNQTNVSFSFSAKEMSLSNNEQIKMNELIMSKPSLIKALDQNAHMKYESKGGINTNSRNTQHYRYVLEDKKLVKFLSSSNNGQRQKIMDLRHAQLVKYHVIKSILEDTWSHKEEIEPTLNKLIVEIASLTEEIEDINQNNGHESYQDVSYEFDDSMIEIERKIEEVKALVMILVKKSEIDLFK